MDTATVLFVCTGNICRSPTAERLLRRELAERGANGSAVRVASAGTGALVGEPIQASAARLLSGAGADIDAFEAQDVTADLVDTADLVLALTRRHRSAIAQLSPKVMPRLFTLREFVRLARAAVDEGWHGSSEPAARLRSLAEAARTRRGIVPATDADDDVPDPYGGPESGYEETFAIIAPAVRDLARLLAPVES